MTWFRHMRSLVCLTLLTMGRQEGGAVPIIAYTGWRCLKGVPLSGFGYIGITLVEVSSSETQGQSVGLGEKARRKVLSTGGFLHPGLEKNEWNEWRYNSANYALRDQVAKKKYQPLSQQWSLLHVAVLSQYWSLCKPTKINDFLLCHFREFDGPLILTDSSWQESVCFRRYARQPRNDRRQARENGSQEYPFYWTRS